MPPAPAGWIITTACNRAIDRLRREVSRADRHARAALFHAGNEPAEEGPVQDDRLRLEQLDLDGYHVFHADRTENTAEQDFLRRRRRALPED